ncbi:MAG: hypothetical protein V3W34_09195 [Phycisphaerae bacterium]
MKSAMNSIGRSKVGRSKVKGPNLGTFDFRPWTFDHTIPQRGRLLCAALMSLCILVGPASAEVIDIRLETATDTYNPGDVVDVDILASTSSLLVAYGFDLDADANLSYTGFDPASGFVGVSATPDGDGIVGLSFSGGVEGVDVLLGTAHFSAVSIGAAIIELTMTPNDLTEGFARFGSGFFDISTAPLALSIVAPDGPITLSGGGGGGGGGNPSVPEPANVVLIASGLFVVVRRRS